MTYTEIAVLTKDFFLKVQSHYNVKARQKVKTQIECLAKNLDEKRDAICFYCDNKNTSVVHAAMEYLQTNTVKLHHLTDELSKPFLLFLVGTGKFGKSTLINALLGCEMAQIDTLPKTWKIDVFYGGKGNQAEIYYQDGHHEIKSFSAVRQLVQEEEKKREESEDEIQELFEAKIDTLKTLKAKREYQEELRKYHLYKSEITEIHWPVPVNPLLQNFRLVDTPGTRQQLTIGHVEATAADYYSKADGILWLLAADKISAKDTRENIDSILNRFGRRTDNIIAVLNKKDLIEKSGGQEALQRVEAEAKRIYGDVFKEIVPISASQALDVVLAQKHSSEKVGPNLEHSLQESGLPKLLNVIDRYFMTRAQQIQVASKLAGTYSILEDTNQEMAKLQERLENDNLRRHELEEYWENECQKLIDRANNMLQACFKAQVELVHRNAAANEDILWDLEGSKRNEFLQTDIFESWSFKRKAEEVVHEITVMIESAGELEKQNSAFYEYPDLQKEAKFLPATTQSLMGKVEISDEVFSTDNGKMVVGGIAALGAAALLGPIGLIAGLAVQSDTFKSLTKWVSKLFVNLPDKISNQYRGQLDKIEKPMQEEIQRLVDQAGHEVERVRESTYSKLYGSSKATEDILKNLEDIHKITERKVKTISLKEVIFSETERRKRHAGY